MGAETSSLELHFQFQCRERGEGCGSSACMHTAASEGATAARQEKRMAPGQLRAMLIQLLFKAIFLSDLMSHRSVFNVPLTCRVPAAAGAQAAPSRHWWKGGGEQGCKERPNQSCSKFVDCFNNRL